MAKKSPRTEAVPQNDLGREDETRDEELSTKSEIEEALLDLHSDIEKGFADQADRSDDLMDYWDLYNCKLTQQQFYSGNSEIFVPIIYNAVNARKTRFVNQMFPQSGRYVEVTSENGDIPHAEMALAEHYVKTSKLRTKVMPALMKNGDVEGQYTICASWQKSKRYVTWKKKAPPEVEGVKVPNAEEVEDIQEDVLEIGGPHVEVIADTDLLVLPATADSIQDALNQGGSITIIRRWSKARIKQMVEDGDLRKERGNDLADEMTKDDKKKDKAKEMVDAIGIKNNSRGKYAQAYETWTMLTIDDERRLCRVYFGGGEKVLSAKRNPYWSDRCPIFSEPVEKIEGSFKGQSKLQAVASFQYMANDACNEGMDAATYALLPIIMTDPEKNPRVGSMILSLAAVWETSPNDTQFAKFPDLWKDAFEIISAARSEIFQTLSVNPAQITQAAGKKPTKADIANEQQVDILTTADAVTVVEEGILTPLVSFMIEMDHQFRDKAMLVKQHGEMGIRASMQEIPPIAMEEAYQFRWFGVEAARNAQQVQQQIAGINMIRGIPPQMYQGKTLDLSPILTQLVENTFGPRMAPLIFKDQRDELSVPPEQENELLQEGFTCPVHLMDDHLQHLQVHKQVLNQDTHGTVRVHMMAHLKALEQQQMQAQQQAKGQPGAPGGAGPGMPGQPQPGAQPQQPKGAQQPPGAIHQDRMQDPQAMPR